MIEEIKAIFDELFHPDSDHHILICKPHGFVLMPGRKAILDHVRQYHTRKKEIAKNISTYLESIGPLLEPDHVAMPASGGPSVPFLKMNSRAYECNECQEVYGCLDGVRVHLRDAHEILPVGNIDMSARIWKTNILIGQLEISAQKVPLVFI